MPRFTYRVYSVVVLAVTFCCPADECAACTGLKLKAKDGSLVYGRSMEFGPELDSNPIVIPRRFWMVGTAEGGRPGLAWESKYAAIGLNGLGVDQLLDGLNEEGLAAGIFYMPGYADYQSLSKDDDARSLAPWELVTWILTSFASVDEVRAALADVRVGALPAPGLGAVPPLHYVVHDLAGQSLVIEYLKGELSLSADPIGVITNSPDFAWHTVNLNNYVSLRAINRPATSLDDVPLAPIGQGSGLFGLPGDYTPPARFVRAVALGHLALEGETGEEAAMQLFHVLNSFDIVRGTVAAVGVNGEKSYELTQWTTANNMTDRTFYYHTHDNRRVRRIELMKLDLDGGQLINFRSQPSQDFEDLQPVGKQD
jgi:choloylglycine hydrolase